jgi:hypothetical protein
VIDKLRHFLLAILVMSMLATGVELVLLEHTESTAQWIPLVLIGVGLLSMPLVVAWPNRVAFAIFRVAMLACVIAGLVGIYLHYRGNVEFELEMNAGLKGFQLFRDSMMGATPALAPGSMTQLGLLGLLYTYRHPRLQNADARRHRE